MGNLLNILLMSLTPSISIMSLPNGISPPCWKEAGCDVPSSVKMQCDHHVGSNGSASETSCDTAYLNFKLRSIESANGDNAHTGKTEQSDFDSQHTLLWGHALQHAPCWLWPIGIWIYLGRHGSTPASGICLFGWWEGQPVRRWTDRQVTSQDQLTRNPQ